MDRDNKVLVSALLELYGISRANENLRKSSAKITLGFVEARLQALEANWSKFEAQHIKLLSVPPSVLSESEYVKQDVPVLAEEAFLLQKGILLRDRDVARSLKAKEPLPSSTTESSATSRTTLPRIQLPASSGKYEDWPAFRDLFLSIPSSMHHQPRCCDVSS